MALVVYDRVQETTTTSGTGSVTLLGAVSGFQSFAVVGNSNTTYYTITDGAQWEVGIGTYSTSGPTLARTTILSNSNGNTSPITLSGGLAQVFVTYTAEKSVNLDASGNVTPLGTIASGTWQGTTVGVSYGGTGVTASSGVNSVVLRDSNGNTQINNMIPGWTSTVSAAGTTVLTVASSYYQRLTGSTTQTFQLPDATTLVTGTTFLFDNDSTGNLTVVNNGGSSIDVIAAGGYSTVFLESNSTTNGVWGRFGSLPSEVNWGTLSADLGGATVSNATWQGTTIATGYGGTGLTSYTSGGALYATSTSSLTSGTLPIASGGTAVTSFTANGVVYGNGTSALGVTSAGTTGQVLLANTGGAPTWGSVPSTGAVTSFQTSLNGLTPSTSTTGAVTLAGTLGTSSGGTALTSFTSGGALYATSTSALTTGTLPIASGGTGQTTASAAFNALSPITTAGDLILGNGANSATRLGIGTNGYVLTSNGTTASWAAASSGVTVTNDTSTATALYPTFTSATSGSISGVSVTSSKFTFVPSTGSLTAPQTVASNGLVVNSNTVSANYSIPSGSSATSTGPMTIASGVAVTVPTGSRWVVL